MTGDYLRPRWRGQPGRLEVWYTTLTDPATGTGIWLHHEVMAPAGGRGQAQALGWGAVFPPGGAPLIGRFGPDDWIQPTGERVFAAGKVALTPGRLCGEAGSLSWDLTQSGGGAPLFTFPRWAWERELLPAAQIVPAPTARFHGTVRAGGQVLPLADAPGATARIYGHGNAKRWAWLHADLGGGDACEIVAAVSHRFGLSKRPPAVFLRLRAGGRDWPAAHRVLPAAFLRLSARIGLPEWSVRGRIGSRRIRVDVVQPPEHTVAVDYADPTGVPTVCRNTERADARIVWERRRGDRWEAEREWHLDGTAHAEVGTQTADPA